MNFFPSNQIAKIHEIDFYKYLQDFLCLKVISMKNESNESCRVGFTLTFVNNMMFIIFYHKCDFLLPNIGHFQVLVIYEGIHRNQVFWHQKVGQTLLYWHQLRNLAQICAKILHTRFPIVLLLGKSSIFQLLLQFDEKIRNFAQKLWSHFSVFFHTVSK